MDTITINLNSEATEPLYEQLYKYIKSEIIVGRFQPDAKLPSKRKLSAHLQCSQNTVQAAYSQLVSEGYITSKPRSGYYVSIIEGIFEIKKESDTSRKYISPHPLFKYEFSHRGVDPDSFPFSTWRRITKEVINEYDPDMVRTGDSQGDLNLRTSIAAYLHYSRDVKCSPDQIIISSGTEFLFQFLIQIFDENSIFGIENPGYEKLNMIFRSNRTSYRAISLDESGMLPIALSESRANIACVTPSHQFPTGRIMPISRRNQMLNWANEAPDRYIIEDDYDSEFKYYGKPIPSMQGLDRGEKVIYIGAFSKSLTPAIRLSYMVLPEPLLKTYYEKLSFYLCSVPMVEQKAMCRFIEEGYFERHLNKMRNIYKDKREALVLAIKHFLPAAEIEGANAGLHLILRIDNGMSEDELVRSARDKGVMLNGISQYYFEKIPYDSRPSLLLGFAALKINEIPVSVALLAEAWFQNLHIID